MAAAAKFSTTMEFFISEQITVRFKNSIQGKNYFFNKKKKEISIEDSSPAITIMHKRLETEWEQRMIIMKSSFITRPWCGVYIVYTSMFAIYS